jgi:hypothetical protein
MAGKKKSELRTQNTEETAQAQAGQAEACPTYTLRADRKSDLLAMIAVLRFGREFGVDNLAELETTVREFELYEEEHRG